MSENAHAEEHAGHHIISPKTYVINAIVITILMLLTVAFGKVEWLNFGHPNGLNLLIALLIAIAKCACIIAIFMGVKWNTPLVKVFALGVIGWLAILFMFTMIDVASPNWGLGTPYGDIGHQGQNSLHGIVEEAAPVHHEEPAAH
jgi:caa(3)-type oxidase subunit IV